jgi:DNA polymerase
MTLDELREKVRTCINCPLSETRINAVFGSGNPNADIMFVGEAPGKNEDETGEPFVGAAGRMLNDFLTASGIRREDVFIGNIVKCRPPMNRDPLPAEEERCIGYLMEQIRIIDPKIIVCLGRIAAKQLISPDFQVTKQHGEVFMKNNRLIMATFHPAALLRNPSYKPATMDDFDTLYDIAFNRNFQLNQ